MAWGIATVLFTKAFQRGRPQDAVLFKNAFGAIVLGVLAFTLGSGRGGGGVGEGNMSWLLVSGALGLAGGDLLYFVALAHIGASRTVILTMITPVLTALMAWVAFGEQLSGQQWTGALLVIGGGVVAESRNLRTNSRNPADVIGVLAALGCAVVFSLGNVLTRWGVSDTEMVTSASVRLAGGAVGLLIIAVFRGNTRTTLVAPFRASTWRAFLLPSAIGTWCGMSLLMGGLTWAKQGVAAAMAAATPLFSLPLAVLILHERPGRRGWMGAILVIAGVVVMARTTG